MADQQGIPVAPQDEAPRPRRRAPSPLTVLGAIALLAFTAVLLLLGIQDARMQSLAQKGEPAPAFVMDRLGGGTVALEDLRGKIVMLDFWATWCPPCIRELPYLVQVAKEYESKGLVFVAANRDDPPETAKAEVGIFVAQRAPELGRFVAFASDAITQRYGVEALPTLFFIDREGRVIEAHRGALSEKQLRARVEAILARD